MNLFKKSPANKTSRSGGHYLLKGPHTGSPSKARQSIPVHFYPAGTNLSEGNRLSLIYARFGYLYLSGYILVGQLIRMNILVIRLRIEAEFHCLNVSYSFNTAFATRCMPSITRPSDDRMIGKLISAFSINRICSTIARQVGLSFLSPDQKFSSISRIESSFTRWRLKFFVNATRRSTSHA